MLTGQSFDTISRTCGTGDIKDLVSNAGTFTSHTTLHLEVGMKVAMAFCMPYRTLGRGWPVDAPFIR